MNPRPVQAGAGMAWGAAANAQLHRLLSDFQRMQRERDEALQALQSAYQDRLRLAIVTEFQSDDGVAHLVRVGCIAEWLALRLGVEGHRARCLRNAAFLYGIRLDEVAEVDPGLPSLRHEDLDRPPEHLGAPGATPLDLGCEVAYGWREHWDGSGGPGGLAGLQIPLSARVVAVANLIDGCSDEVRGANWPMDEVCAVLRLAAGRQLDPHLVGVACGDESELQALRVRLRQSRPPMAELLRDF